MALFETGLYRKKLSSNEVVKGALIQYNWCPCKKRKLRRGS
jgi:hypothetical protein